MAAGIQFTNYVPTSLVGVNSASPTLAAEVVTGAPIPTGAFPGNVFYLTEAQAQQLSTTAANGATQLTCHAGWYMVVKVAATATASLIAQGYIGARASIATTAAAENASIPPQAVVTDVVSSTTALGAGQNPVVFLGPVTPGNYTIVQVAGDASVYASAAVAAVGEALAYSTTTAEVTLSAAPTTYAIVQTLVGLSQNVTTAAGLARVNVKFPFGVI